MKLIEILLRPVIKPIEQAAKAEASHFVYVMDIAPECCGKKMEFITEHRTFSGMLILYQCSACKTIETVSPYAK